MFDKEKFYSDVRESLKNEGCSETEINLGEAISRLRCEWIKEKSKLCKQLFPIQEMPKGACEFWIEELLNECPK